MARPKGLEPLAHSLEGCCSIQLSYGRIQRWILSLGAEKGQGLLGRVLLLDEESHFLRHQLGEFLDAHGAEAVGRRVAFPEDGFPFLTDALDPLVDGGKHSLPTPFPVEADGEAMDLVLHPHEEEEKRRLPVEGIGVSLLVDDPFRLVAVVFVEAVMGELDPRFLKGLGRRPDLGDAAV